jgi:hypothetical protein
LVFLLPVAGLAAQPATRPAIDPETRLVDASGLSAVKAQCTGCHSANRIFSRRLSAEGWQLMLRAKKQKGQLHDLGAQETIIMDYLSRYYGAQ